MYSTFLCIISGKPKRAAWDLKGRLQDMENLVKSSTIERENFLVKLASYDSRIENLEVEKQNLNQNLQKTQTVSLANQEEVERLTNNIRFVKSAFIMYAVYLKIHIIESVFISFDPYPHCN